MNNYFRNPRAFGLLLLLMSVASFFRIVFEFWRLLFDADWTGANDLRTFHNGVQGWFAGRDVYAETQGTAESAAYPPATYSLLWPLLGWLNFEQARWLWAATIIVMILWMILQMVRETGPESKQEVAFVALLLLSMNGTGVTIGNGQLTLHILPPLLAGLVFWIRRSETWITDAGSALLLLFASAKPTIFVPFFILILVRSFRMRPLLFFVSGYVLLTAFSMLFQDRSMYSVFTDWLSRGSDVSLAGGYGNLYSWLATIGKEEWAIPASIAALAAFSVWAYACRRSDLWIQLGITGLFARTWTYHRMYDDVLLLFPMLALLRKSISGEAGVSGRLLLCFIVLLNLARLSNISATRYMILTYSHQILWGATLLFLFTRLKTRENSN